MSNRRWAFAQNLAGILFLLALLWLKSEFLPTFGGGAALILVGGYAGLLKSSDAGAREPLLRLSMLAYALMALNFLVGTAGAELPVEALWLIGIHVLTLASIGLVVGVVELYLPPPSIASTGRGDARSRLVIPVAIVLFSPLLQLLRWIVPAETAAAATTIALGALLVSTLLAGFLLVAGITAVATGSTTKEACRKLLWFAPVWIGIGSGAEVLRGAWGVWCLSALTVVSAQASAYVLSSRALPRVVTGRG